MKPVAESTFCSSFVGSGAVIVFIGICFLVLHRRSTPGLILKIAFSVSKQGRKPDFRELDHLFQDWIPIESKVLNHPQERD